MTPAFDATPSHCSGNVALPWQELSNWSEKIVLNTLPRHQNLRKRGCAAGVNNSFTHGDEMERRRYTDAPAFWCCVSAEPGGVQWRADVLACPLEAASCVCCVLTAACTSACAQRVQPRSTRSTTCSLLAGPAVLLPPGQRLFASGNTFLDDIRCDCQRSNSRDRTPRSP